MIRAMGHATVGLELAASIVVGYFMGDWLDGRFDTGPWFTMVFVLLGIAAGFRNIFRLASRAMRRDAEASAKEAEAAEDPQANGDG